MTKYPLSMLAAFGLLLLLVSCGRPECKNTNPIFDQYPFHTKEYKDELAKQLKLADSQKLTYWVNSYHDDPSTPAIIAFVQGDGLCARIILNIGHSQTGIEKLIKVKGESYRGAELKGLQFDAVEDSSKTEFVFRSVERIVD